MKYHPNICPFYLIQMLWGRAQLFLTDPRRLANSIIMFQTIFIYSLFCMNVSPLSLSHTEHMAYTVGHSCKPYIQPNKPWSYLRYTRAVRVYPWKLCMIFKTFKKLTRVPCPCMIVIVIVQDRERPCETVRDRIYNRTWSPLHEWAQSVLYDRHTTNTVSYDCHTTNTV